MKKGDIIHWFKLTFDGELKWYKAQVIQWDWSEDVANMEIFEKIYNNTPRDVVGRYQIDKSELWTTQKLIDNKKRLFKTIFKVLENK